MSLALKMLDGDVIKSCGIAKPLLGTGGESVPLWWNFEWPVIAHSFHQLHLPILQERLG